MSARPAFKGAVVYLDTSVLDKITEELKPRAKKIVNTYGLLMTGDAAKSAPVGTPESTGIPGYVGGTLRSSVTSESQMTGDMQFTVSDGVDYGLWVEMGTSRMAARPFMLPAVEKWRQQFLDAFSGLFK
jgi:HK97 gp10 family phage protein